jgi:hypothetical protein
MKKILLMKNSIQKILFILFIALASCQDEQSIINEAPDQANDVCPGDYTSYFLTLCKWKIINHSSVDYSVYSFSFIEDGTFTAENTSDNTSQEGTWLSPVLNGTGSFVRLNFDTTTALSQIAGDWDIKTCNLNYDTASFDLELGGETFTFAIDCD